MMYGWPDGRPHQTSRLHSPVPLKTAHSAISSTTAVEPCDGIPAAILCVLHTVLLNITMRATFLFLLSFVGHLVSASVLLPRLHSTSLAVLNGSPYLHSGSSDRNRESYRRGSTSVAMAIPGYSLGEQVVVGGMLNFLQLYNFIITARVLLSWFPQAQVIMISRFNYGIYNFKRFVLIVLYPIFLGHWHPATSVCHY